VTVTNPTAPTEPPRDRWGRYLIPDPVTGEPRPYTRVTTFAKLASDTFGLTAWQVRKVVEGMAARPDLVLAASALTAEDKKALDKIAEAAKEHAGGSTGATIGTAIHSLSEQIDRGETPNVAAPYDADLAAYRDAIAAAGLTILPEWIEQVVAVPELEVAGTLDRIVATPDGRLVIADLKTGRTLPFGEISIQLALYANASHVFDVASGALRPMPDVDRAVGLVFHLPAGTGRCEVIEVDIAAGAAMFPTLAAVQRWRKRKDLSTPYLSPVAVADAAAGDLETDALDAAAALATLDLGGDTAARLEWIDATLRRLDERGHLPALAEVWPANTRTPRQARDTGEPLVDAELDAIFDAVVKLAGRLSLDFDLFPAPYPGDVDAPVLATDPRLADLRVSIGKLPADLADRVAAEVTAAGVPRLSSGKARVGHLAVVRRSVETATADYVERLRVRAAHLEHIPEGARSAAEHAAGFDGTYLTVTAAAVDALGCIGDGIDVGLLVVGEDGALQAGPDAERLILDHFGGKRPFLDAAKRAADVCRTPKPGSAVKAMENPAVTAVAYFTTPQP